MEQGLIGSIVDRAITNARVITGAPEAVALVAIITLGVSYFTFQHFHHERVADLNDRIASQARLLIDYRSQLNGATPDEAANHV